MTPFKGSQSETGDFQAPTCPWSGSVDWDGLGKAAGRLLPETLKGGAG